MPRSFRRLAALGRPGTSAGRAPGTDRDPIQRRRSKKERRKERVRDPSKNGDHGLGRSPPRKTEVSPDIRTLPANSSILGAGAFETKLYREPGEVIRSLSGVDFVSYGQGGVPSGPSVRGYTDRNFGQDIAGFLDGIPLNIFGFVASHGAMDMTILPPEAVERVELVRGPLDARFGDFHRGASVNFVTKDGVAAPSIALSGGSYGQRRALATFGNADPGVRKLSLMASVDAQGNDGYSENQKVERLRVFGKAVIPLGQTDLAITGLHFTSEWDAPSYLDLADIRSGRVDERDAVNPTDGGEQDQTLVYLRFRHAPDTPSPLVFTAYGSQKDWTRYRSDFLISPAQRQTHQNDQRTTLGCRLEKSFGLSLGAHRLLVLLGTTLQRDDAETRQNATINRELFSRTDDVDELLMNIGAYTQVQWAPTPWMKVLGGVRYSHLDYELEDNIRAPGTYVDSYSDDQISPKFGISVEPIRNVELYANYATGMRSPTPRTEVRNSLGSIARVEIAETESFEVGVTARVLDRLHFHADVFRADNSNEIRGIPPGGVQFESLGASRREGIDFEVNWFPGPSTRVFAGLSWVDVVLQTPVTPAANHLPDIPDYVHQAGAETQLDAPGSLPGRLTLAADLSLYGNRNLNTLGTLQSQKYERATAKVVYHGERSYRVWLGSVWYPGSRYGESAFLFGSRVGVRANPRLTVEGGVAYTFE
ncbi:MAG: TonB-dependent receptor [Thermoanaerobaculia bacterium]